jgi:hypothetical protein
MLKTRIPHKFKIKFTLKTVWIMAIYMYLSAMIYLQDLKKCAVKTMFSEL